MKDSDTFTFFGEKTDITRKELRELVIWLARNWVITDAKKNDTKTKTKIT